VAKYAQTCICICMYLHIYICIYIFRYIICIYVHIGGIYVSAIFSPCEFLVICACLIKRNVFLDSSSKVRLLASLSTNNNFGSNHKKSN